MFMALAALLALPYAALAANDGFSGTIESLDGGLGGTVTVVDESTIMISDYTLEDASAPALYWWGATNDDLSGGFRISNDRVTEAASSDEITIDLNAGRTADEFSVVGLWCEQFAANFGQATLTEDGADSADSDSDDGDKNSTGRLSGGASASAAALLTATALFMCLA